jgi:hypothetical protein
MKFKVGDKVLCHCGSSYCTPCTIIVLDERGMEVIDENGESGLYNPEDYPKIKLLTKIEKVMK